MRMGLPRQQQLRVRTTSWQHAVAVGVGSGGGGGEGMGGGVSVRVWGGAYPVSFLRQLSWAGLVLRGKLENSACSSEPTCPPMITILLDRAS